VLHTFVGGSDGANPYGGVIADPAGNLYGTTYAGGTYNGGVAAGGVIYKLDTSGHETLLYTFTGRGGGSPSAGMVRDAAGNLYGTAGVYIFKLSATGKYAARQFFGCRTGGDVSAGLTLDAAGNLYGTTDIVPSACLGNTLAPFGEVYKFDTAGKLTTLYKFSGPSKTGFGVAGGVSNGGVVLDSAGNLYGTTPNAGLAGAVYKVPTAGSGTNLYSFPDAPGGDGPGPLTIGQAGEFYGATVIGGVGGAGVVYKMDVAGKETVLYSFTGGADGAWPSSRVVSDSAGNLYGTTKLGGAANQGVVYKVDTAGHETVLHSFTDGADGALPNGVVLDPAGNLYGTTFGGGVGGQTGAQEGVVFKLDPAGRQTVLHSFTGLSDGGVPTTRVIRDSAGNLYGTTAQGGFGAGVVYEIDTVGHFTVLYTFTGGSDGGNPAGVIRDSAGNLYGTTADYGTAGMGTVFELSAAGNYTVLYTFSGYADGGSPEGGVVRDSAGNLYGNHVLGRFRIRPGGYGVLFEIDPSGHETVLHAFTGGADGGGGGVLILDAAGALYGNGGGGLAGGGVLYKIALP